MESSDSSPHYMKATSSSHAKKENSPGECEFEDTISVGSSTVGSAVNGQYAPRSISGIPCRTNNKKTLKNLVNVKSFRRRARPRILQPIEMFDNTEALVDASESSTHYLKSTSCSLGEKMNPQSSSDGSRSTSLGSKLPSRRRLFKTMSRTPSIKNVRILIKKTSFKPRRPLLDHSVSEEVAVDRATYSSTLKYSNFPQPVEVPVGGTQSQNNLGTKVCRYHHCSLHGQCREDHDSVSPPKRFLHKKRQPSMKPKNEIVKSDQCNCETIDETKNLQKPQMVSITNSSVQDGGKGKGMNLYLPLNDAQSYEARVEGYSGIRDFDFLEIAFGETSFPERSYEENLIIMKKYSPQEQQFGGMSLGITGYCLKCSSKIAEQGLSTPRSSDHATNSSLDKGNTCAIPLNVDTDVLDTHSLAHIDNSKELNIRVGDQPSFITDECKNGTTSKDILETPVAFDEVTKDGSVSSSLSDSQTLSDNNSEVEGELVTITSITGDSITSEVVQIPESGNDRSANEGSELQFSKPRHMSMWHLIHQHMASELATEAVNKPLPSAEDQDLVDNKSSFHAKESSVASQDCFDSNIGAENESETQDIEVRKLFAIKLVREAIEKILLPEVQDDLSVTSENISPKEYAEKKQNEDCSEESYVDPDTEKGKDCIPSTTEDMSPTVEDSFNVKMVITGQSTVSKSDNKAPRHWSNLKKWILLQRFIRELEKVKKFNPRKNRQLLLSPDPESEKVKLRPLALDEKKRGEEWMLDYALRQAVNQLGPTQKRKVASLVKAFETVVPPLEDYQIQHRRGKHGVPVAGKGVLLGNDKVSGLVTATEESSATLIKKYCNLLNSNQNVSKSECGGPSVTTKSLIIDNAGKSIVTKKMILAEPDVQIPQEDETSDLKDTNGAVDEQVYRKDHIKMWHMVYQHVVSCIADKMGSQLLGGSDDEDDKLPGTSEENHISNNRGSEFTKSDALKLVKDAVDEILLPNTGDNISDSLSVSTEQDISEVGEQEKSNPKNWKKLKTLLLLKQSIKALERARKLTQAHVLLTREPYNEPERVDLRRQLMDEKRKAEQWMLDYAVQHIVTKLNPSRKRRVSMLVEAFEAVVPFPDI